MEKTLDRIAHIFSYVFTPILVPTYGIILAFTLSFLATLPASSRIGVTVMVFLITGFLPMLAIGLMWKAKIVSEPGLNNRNERLLPYILTCVAYMVCAYYLASLGAPVWLWTFMAGAALAVIICIVVNRCWKISAHMTAMGGVVAILFRIAGLGLNMYSMTWWLVGAVLISGAVATSRVLLGRHTLGQVLAGTAVGFLCVFFLSML